MNDTPVRVEQQMASMCQALTPSQRLSMVSRMRDAGIQLMRSGLLRDNKNLSEAQLRARMFVRLYGDDYAHGELQRIIGRMPDMLLE